MGTAVVYETHSTTEDNENGFATGWLDGRLTAVGRDQARQMGERRRDDGIDAVFTSDLGRAVESVAIAFDGVDVPILHDWRLRECDYGSWNGAARDVVLGDPQAFIDAPYPGGESWRQAVERVGRFVRDLELRWDERRVLVVGHAATRYGLDVALGGKKVEEVVGAEFDWQPGWEYAT